MANANGSNSQTVSTKSAGGRGLLAYAIGAALSAALLWAIPSIESSFADGALGGFAVAFLWTLAVLGFWILLLVAATRATDFFTYAFGLDLAVSTLTWIPPAILSWRHGWAGLAGAIVAQGAALQGFCLLHLFANPGRPLVIRKTLNRLVGTWRNVVGVAATAIAVPVFWLIRAAEIVVYPILVWTLDFPRYNTREWVNVSRHKFDGLIAHDLVWCLYCDWMTGVYSLGAEMLRNVESFWCPIKFYGKKCENCALDFPDAKNAWVPADSNMAEVGKVLDEQYTKTKHRSWFGHPERGGPGAPGAPAKTKIAGGGAKKNKRK